MSSRPFGDVNIVPGHAELLGARVHLVDEGVHRARDVFGERHRGVVGRLEQERVEELVDADPLPLDQPEPRDARDLSAGGLLADRDDVGEVRALDHQERGHDLRDARDRPALVAVQGEQHLPGVEIREDRGRRV